MPSNIARFEQLMYVSLGIGILVAALQYASVPSRLGVAFTLFVLAFVFGITIIFIWLIARRRANWARWILLFGTLIGIVISIPILSQRILHDPLSGILNVIQCFMQGTALYLVFTGNAVGWFKRSSESQQK